MIDFLIAILVIQYLLGWIYYSTILQEVENRSHLITTTLALVLGGVIGGIMHATARDFKKAWNNK